MAGNLPLVCRQVVEVKAEELRSIAAQDFMGALRAKPFPDLLDGPAAVREGAFVVWIIITPD